MIRMYKKGSKKNKSFRPKITLAIGRVYAVKGYWTGEFRGECRESRNVDALMRVTDPMKTELNVGDDLEIAFTLAEFMPAIVEDFQPAKRASNVG